MPGDRYWRTFRRARWEKGQNHNLVNSLFENTDNGLSHKGGQQIELKPRVAHLERARPLGRSAPLFLDANHATGPDNNLKDVLLEQILASDQADKSSLFGADRINWDMARNPELRCIGDGKVGG